MASEARRRCGYRKVGGLYLCADGAGAPCCKLPFPLKVCPTCNSGVKQTRGWTWIDPRPWLQGECRLVASQCPLAFPDGLGERVGLLWIGEQFYPTPSHFQREAQEMGISRRIAAIPRGFELGRDWVFLAHPKMYSQINPETLATEWTAGVFRVIKPDRIEKIVTQSQADDQAEMDKLAEAGITPVVVPDDDKHHQGNVYDDDQTEMFAQ